MKEFKTEWKNPYNLIFSLLFAAGTGCISRVVYSGDLFGKIGDNYLKPLSFSTAAVFLIAFLLAMAFCGIVEPLIFRGLGKLKQSEPGKRLWLWAIFLILAWLPYYLSFYPGGVYSDTLTSIGYAADNILTNRHPFLYNCIIWIFVHLGYYLNRSLAWSVGLLCAVQMLLLGMEVLLFLRWMDRKRVNRWLRTGAGLFLILFPLIPLYGISVWKDTPFCMAVLLWTMGIADLYTENKAGWMFWAGMTLTAFTRNNGAYVCAFVFLILLFSVKNRKIKWKSAVLLVLIFLVQGPGYRLLGVKQTEPVENFGIPLQQIGATAAYDGNIPDEEQQVIDRLFPEHNLKESYAPCNVDVLKWNSGFDAEYFDSHIPEFLKLWFSLMKQNFGIYVRAYLMETLGYWDYTRTSANAYVQTDIWPQNNFGMEQTDLLAKTAGFSIREILEPDYLLSAGLLFWITLLSCFMTAKHKGAGTFLLLAPQIGIWLTVMVATPIAFSFRYVAPLMFTLPFVFLIPHLLKNPEA